MLLNPKNTIVALAFFAIAGLAHSDTFLDPLHGYCGGVGQCIDGGSNSPTTNNPPVNFGFTVSPGPASGVTLLIDILQPNDVPSAPVTLTGTYAGTATLFSSTAWTSGGLDTYLGISSSPANPIGAFLPDPADPSATGFFVYQLAITPVGGITLQGPSNPNVNPLENISSGPIPIGSYIIGFFNEGTVGTPNWISTANSGAILVTSDGGGGGGGGQVPEPGGLVLLAGGFAALVYCLHRGRRARATGRV